MHKTYFTKSDRLIANKHFKWWQNLLFEGKQVKNTLRLVSPTRLIKLKRQRIPGVGKNGSKENICPQLVGSCTVKEHSGKQDSGSCSAAVCVPLLSDPARHSPQHRWRWRVGREMVSTSLVLCQEWGAAQPGGGGNRAAGWSCSGVHTSAHTHEGESQNPHWRKRGVTQGAERNDTL